MRAKKRQNDKTTDNDKKDGLDWTMLGRCRRTSQLGINDTTAGLGGRWSAVDLLAVCSLPEWVLLADSLVLAKTCVCEPVWPLCAAMRRVVQARMAEESRRGREEEEGESPDQKGRYAREKRAGRNNEWPGRGISFNPFYALGRAQATGTAGNQVRGSARLLLCRFCATMASRLRLRLCDDVV
jgi:hypothetical protein